jgi:pseudouridine-5'-phosphate glycosidase/pseudouridine kinase
VHRDYNESMDVSADLFELGQTNVAVISSGIKSILDIGKTLEYLETLGVCVCALNESGSTEFPAFFTSKSGFNAPYNLKSSKDAASLINTHIGTGLKSGILIGIPVPSEHSIDSKLIEESINDALKLAKEQNIYGKHVTPFLLEKINRITRGTSMKSNIALIQNNARIGARIAKELAGLRHTVTNAGQGKSAGQSGYSFLSPHPSLIPKSSTAQVTLIGGINLDSAYKLKDEKTLTTKGVTQPCEFSQYMGGVARNMSESLLHLGIARTNLLGALATDFSGQYIIEQSKRIGFDTSKWLLLDSATETSTGSYCAVFDTKGELISGYGAMDSHCLIRPSYIAKHIDILAESSLCVVDANCPVETLEYIGNVCAEHGVPLWYNPTDVRKSAKIIEANQLTRTTYVSPNLKELYTMFAYLYRQKIDVSGDSRMTQDELGQLGRLVLNNSQANWTHDEIRLMIKYMLQYVPYIILTMGKSDLILASRNPIGLYDRDQLPIKKSNRKIQYRTEWSPQLIHLPIVDLDRDELVVNVSGAGDSTSSGIIAGILKGYDLISSAYNGLLAAKYTLLTQKNVSESLTSIDTNALNKCIGKYKGRIRIEKL